MSQHIHNGQPVLTAGAPLPEAQAALILLHGRGATAQSILPLGHELGLPDLAYLAPQAAMNAWYPQRFIVPRAANEPYLSSALAVLEGLVAHLAEQGIPDHKVAIAGFSQGACLALEYVARHPRTYGAAAAFSGGLIGADDELVGYEGALDGMPIFLGCSDVDFHIPLERVQASTTTLRSLGAEVTERIYPGMGHTVNQDELDHLRGMMARLLE